MAVVDGDGGERMEREEEVSKLSKSPVSTGFCCAAAGFPNWVRRGTPAINGVATYPNPLRLHTASAPCHRRQLLGLNEWSSGIDFALRRIKSYKLVRIQELVLYKKYVLLSNKIMLALTCRETLLAPKRCFAWLVQKRSFKRKPT